MFGARSQAYSNFQTYSNVQERSRAEFSLLQKWMYYRWDQNRTDLPPPWNLLVWLGCVVLECGGVVRRAFGWSSRGRDVDEVWHCAYCMQRNEDLDLLWFSVARCGNADVDKR